ncbi:MAG: hypothetical protein JWM87_677 [Candidatus Eremiobacteraeota bacterium]|nr:hypothetical protein [Candidatus Eremiobacteraeota bacterium]
MMNHNPPATAREIMLARLLFISSFSTGIDTGALSFAISDGLADRRDARRLRQMVGAVTRLRRSYEGLGEDARARLGVSRYERRANFARGVLASADA